MLMGKLIYSITTSLDGYVADEKGNFDWTNPSAEVLAFINHNLGHVGTFLLGRNMHKVLSVWDTLPTHGPDKNMNDFAKIWRAAQKIVYSESAPEVSTKNTTIEHSFDPNVVQRLKLQSDKDLNIGGPNLAAQAIKAGLVDEYHQFIVPLILGKGNPWLPQDVHQKLELVDVRRFANGVVHLQYKPA